MPGHVQHLVFRMFIHAEGFLTAQSLFVGTKLLLSSSCRTRRNARLPLASLPMALAQGVGGGGGGEGPPGLCWLCAASFGCVLGAGKPSALDEVGSGWVEGGLRVGGWVH